ncbi:MAG: alpha/beta hydrolase [Woeseiaceae bacterium]
MIQTTKRLIRFTLWLATLVVAVLTTIWLVRAFESRNKPDMFVWHTYETEQEFRADDYPNGITLGEYLELEDRLFAELDEHVYSTVEPSNRELFNRYNKQGNAYAGDDGMAWNRTFVIDTPDARGGILLLHGASDSPYSVRALAESFAKHGLYVAAFRLPGHGTIPTGLKNADLEDWQSIARSGIRHVAEKVGVNRPVYFGGYSAGAALALDYSMDAVFDDSLRTPDKLFLYSPSVAVTPFARFSDWDLALAALPWFRKFAWMDIEIEYDPYKYNSFPKNGGFLAYQLSENIVTKMARVTANDAVRLPPTIAFQSLVDSTVRTDAVIYNVFDQLPENGNELVLFDVNRSEIIQHFMKDNQSRLLAEMEAKAPTNYKYTLVTNQNEQTTQVQSRSRAAGAMDTINLDLPLSWPDDVYSLSHVAIPFAPTDRKYGAYDEYGLPIPDSFNNTAPRGERAVMSIPIDRLMRLRYNPFYAYVEDRSIGFCEVCLPSPAVD